jgi:hypothetical protein
MWMWMVGTDSDSRISSVRLETQEIRFHERVQYLLAQRPLDAAEPLRLFKGQSQARHFQILGADTFEQCAVRHGNLSATVHGRVKLDASFSSFGMEPVIQVAHVVSVFASMCKGQIVGASGNRTASSVVAGEDDHELKPCRFANQDTFV